MKTDTIIPVIPPWVKFRPISGCFGHSGQFWSITDFGFKKKKKSYLLGFEPFFFLFFSSLLVGFGPANLPFVFYLHVVQVTGNVFNYLSASLLFLKCYVLKFLAKITFLSLHFHAIPL